MPKGRRVRIMLDPVEAMFESSPWIRVDDPDLTNRWNNDGTLDRQEADVEIVRGALQLTASRLVGQHTQEIRGEYEMHDGARRLVDAMAIGRRYYDRMMKAEKAKSKKGRRTVPDGTL